MNDPIVSVVGWTALLSGLAMLRVSTMRDEEHTPKAFLERKDCAPVAQPIVCIGDSLTRGNLSADWVSFLREMLGSDVEDSATVLNAGVNMECSTNIHKRLDEVVACKPSHVTVLVGTNDLKAELSPVEGYMYRVFGKLPSVPSLETYEGTLTEIRERLLEAGAKVALVSPPVLGEDMNSRANERAALFAEAVQRVAEGGGENCTYVPLFERTMEALPKDGGRPYCGQTFFVYCCMLTVDLYLRGRNLADVQRERNLGVTVDLVHLGPKAASDLASMVANFVRKGVSAEVLDLPEVPFAPMGGPSSRLVMAAAGGAASARRLQPRLVQGTRRPSV